MSTVVIYDSIYGNTERVAKAIGAALESTGPVKVLPVSEAKTLDLATVERLVVGSPTRGFSPTPAIAEFVEGLRRADARQLKTAVFDTRLASDAIQPAPLRWVVNAGGYAAERIANSLRHRGFDVAEPGGGFLVGGTDGPLKPGELERADQWARSVFQASDGAV